MLAGVIRRQALDGNGGGRQLASLATRARCRLQLVIDFLQAIADQPSGPSPGGCVRYCGGFAVASGRAGSRNVWASAKAGFINCWSRWDRRSGPSSLLSCCPVGVPHGPAQRPGRLSSVRPLASALRFLSRRALSSALALATARGGL